MNPIERALNFIKRLTLEYPDDKQLNKYIALMENDLLNDKGYDKEIHIKMQKIGDPNLIFKSISEALHHAKDGNIIVVADRLCKLFTNQKDYEDYICAILPLDLHMKCIHYQIIKANEVQKLVFVCDNVTNENLIKIKDLLMEYFDELKEHDIKFVPQSNNSYDIILNSILGTLDANLLKTIKFSNYVKKSDPDLEKKINQKESFIDGGIEYIKFLITTICTNIMDKKLSNQELYKNPIIIIGNNNNIATNGSNINNTISNEDRAKEWIGKNPPTKEQTPTKYLELFNKETKLNVSNKKLSQIMKEQGYIQKSGSNSRYWCK